MDYYFILMFLLIISIFLHWKYKIKVYPTVRKRILIPCIYFGIGVIWDSYAVYKGNWIFGGLLGITIGFLPLEEYLFFLIFPYFMLVSYKVLIKEL